MGEEARSSSAASLRIVIDDENGARRAAGRVVRQRTIGDVLTISVLLFAAGNLWLGVTGFTPHTGVWFAGVQFAAAAYFVGSALIVQQRGAWQVIVPAELCVTDDRIVYHIRGERNQRSCPWRSIHTVENTEDAFLISMGAHRWWTKALFVPKPADAGAVEAIWATFYRHLVATRGLRPSRPGRLGIITNTAFV